VQACVQIWHMCMHTCGNTCAYQARVPVIFFTMIKDRDVLAQSDGLFDAVVQVLIY
jgi:hypothetical protein